MTSDEFFTSDAKRASLCRVTSSSVSAALSSASATCDDSASRPASVVSVSADSVVIAIRHASCSRTMIGERYSYARRSTVALDRERVAGREISRRCSSSRGRRCGRASSGASLGRRRW